MSELLPLIELIEKYASQNKAMLGSVKQKLNNIDINKNKDKLIFLH